jgi:hypothetical protein
MQGTKSRVVVTRQNYDVWSVHPRLLGWTRDSFVLQFHASRLSHLLSERNPLFIAVQPDVLILVGPFVDADAELVAQAQTTDSLTMNLGSAGKSSAGILAEINKHLQMAVSQTKVRLSQTLFP